MRLFTILVVMSIILFLCVLALIKYRKGEDNDLCKPNIFQFDGLFNNYMDSDVLRFPFSDIVDQYKIRCVKSFNEANTILFTDYTLYDQHFAKLPYKEKCNYKIFAVNGIDLLANKKILAEKLKGTRMIPKSYPLDSDDSKFDLLKNHTDGNLYIVKSNAQRQEGIMITSDVNFIMNEAFQNNFVVAQELLQNPMLVNGRKINIRVYLLIVIKGNVCDWYIYHDGFIYFSPEKFVKGSISRDINVTSGFIDRSIYKDNPLTTQDLYALIGDERATLLQNNIEELFSNIRSIYKNDLIKLNQTTPGLKFCVYGTDIAPDENLNVQILECNKGASLDKKDERDGQLKFNMIRDCFGVVGIISGQGVNTRNYKEIKKNE